MSNGRTTRAAWLRDRARSSDRLGGTGLAERIAELPQGVVESGLHRARRDRRGSGRCRRRSGRGSSATPGRSGGPGSVPPIARPTVSRSSTSAVASPTHASGRSAMSTAGQRVVRRSRSRQVFTRMRWNHGSSRSASLRVASLSQAVTNASWTASSAAAASPRIGAGQAVAGVEIAFHERLEQAGPVDGLDAALCRADRDTSVHRVTPPEEAAVRGRRPDRSSLGPRTEDEREAPNVQRPRCSSSRTIRPSQRGRSGA